MRDPATSDFAFRSPGKRSAPGGVGFCQLQPLSPLAAPADASYFLAPQEVTKKRCLDIAARCAGPLRCSVRMGRKELATRLCRFAQTPFRLSPCAPALLGGADGGVQPSISGAPRSPPSSHSMRDPATSDFAFRSPGKRSAPGGVGFCQLQPLSPLAARADASYFLAPQEVTKKRCRNIAGNRAQPGGDVRAAILGTFGASKVPRRKPAQQAGETLLTLET